MSTSKKLILYLFVNCSLLEIFTMIMTAWNMYLSAKTGITMDYTPLMTLLGTVVGEVISYGIYAVKAKAENTAGGISYDLAMKEADAAKTSATQAMNAIANTVGAYVGGSGSKVGYTVPTETTSAGSSSDLALNSSNIVAEG